MSEIIPTVVPTTLDDVIQARARYSAFSSSLHIDSTDGIFAPSQTWLPMSGEKLPDASSVQYEVHLMVDNPLSLGVSFALAGAKRIIGHVEAFNNAECAQEAFEMWQKAGATEVGIALLYATSLEEMRPYIQICDFVHVMTIADIGKQGLKFEPESVARVAEIHTRYPAITISTDGGGNAATIRDLAQAGATRFCIGSALAKAKDPAQEYIRLCNAAKAI